MKAEALASPLLPKGSKNPQITDKHWHRWHRLPQQQSHWGLGRLELYLALVGSS